MANPLAELKSMMTPTGNKYFRGVVMSIEDTAVKVRMHSGTIVQVWGTAKLGNTVLVSGKTIVATISTEAVNTVYVS
jgi:hypothetical protein